MSTLSLFSRATTFAALLVPALTGCALDTDAADVRAASSDDTHRSPRAGHGKPSKTTTVAPAPVETTTTTTTAGPYAGYRLHVEPNGNAARTAIAWRDTNPEGARLMDAMALQPLGIWVGDWTREVTATVDSIVTRAGGELQVIVVYNIPYRDCGAWSSGGATSAAAYDTFIAQIAAGLRGRQAIVVLEPDALPLTTCLTSTQYTERMSLMSKAVDTLTMAGADVYLDAGDSNWIGATEMSSRLIAAGVQRAAGFSLNVSHTETTPDSVAYAERIRAIVGRDAHYIVDTGRNGLGASPDNEWCNPLGRALGDVPTTVTGIEGADAFLWVKPPGESDGSCNGGPIAGKWWPEYAADLARTAGW